MIKHIVLWKLKEDIDKEEIFALLRDQFDLLAPKVRGMISHTMSRGFAGYDICLETIFTDLAALKQYEVQPEHQEYKKLPAQYRTERASCDYYLEEEENK